MTNIPFPWMARSLGLELVVMVPWLKFAVMSATIVPSPIWVGLVPPLSAVGAEPRVCVCENCVANVAVDALNPTVAEFARLLPITSMDVSAAFMPVSAVLRVDSNPMGYLP